jgi:hypothetical protein
MGLKKRRVSDRHVLGEVPVELWEHPSMTRALVQRDMGVVLGLVREHAGWPWAWLRGGPATVT